MIDAIAVAYVRRRLARSFDGVHVRGLDATRSLVAREPVLFAANHVSWWDGLLMIHACGLLGIRPAFLMDANNLARMRWVRHLGAIGLAAGPASRHGLRRAVEALDRPGGLWIFPQGRQRPASARPLGLKPGVDWLHTRSDAPVVPVALTYGWREAPQPTAVVAFGEPVRGVALLGLLERALVAELDATEAWLDAGAPGEPLLPSRASSPDRGLGAKMLSWLAG